MTRRALGIRLVSTGGLEYSGSVDHGAYHVPWAATGPDPQSTLSTRQPARWVGTHRQVTQPVLTLGAHLFRRGGRSAMFSGLLELDGLGSMDSRVSGMAGEVTRFSCTLCILCRVWCGRGHGAYQGGACSRGRLGRTASMARRDSQRLTEEEGTSEGRPDERRKNEATVVYTCKSRASCSPTRG